MPGVPPVSAVVASIFRDNVQMLGEVSGEQDIHLYINVNTPPSGPAYSVVDAEGNRTLMLGGAKVGPLSQRLWALYESLVGTVSPDKYAPYLMVFQDTYSHDQYPDFQDYLFIAHMYLLQSLSAEGRRLTKEEASWLYDSSTVQLPLSALSPREDPAAYGDVDSRWVGVALNNLFLKRVFLEDRYDEDRGDLASALMNIHMGLWRPTRALLRVKARFCAECSIPPATVFWPVVEDPENISDSDSDAEEAK